VDNRDTKTLYEDSYRRTRDDGKSDAYRVRLAEENLHDLLSVLQRAEVHADRVIEIGCGEGHLLERLSAAGVGQRLVGYDIAETAIDHLHKREIAGLAGAFAFDGERLPEADDSFDLAIFSYVLEHTPHPEVLLAEAARVARHVAVQVDLTETAIARLRGKRSYEGMPRLSPMDARAIHALLRQAGLHVLAERHGRPSRAVRLYWNDSSKARVKAQLADVLWRAGPTFYSALMTSNLSLVCRRAGPVLAPQARDPS
jgi:SAM-dependent methyltransferase